MMDREHFPEGFSGLEGDELGPCDECKRDFPVDDLIVHDAGQWCNACWDDWLAQDAALNGRAIDIANTPGAAKYVRK
jgi:hypothetical protein